MGLKTAPPTVRHTRAVVRTTNHRRLDVIGVVLIGFAILTFISLVTQDSGVFGHFASGILRNFLGKVAFAFPIFFTVIGAISIAGKRPDGLRRIAWGLALGIITLAASMSQTLQGDFFDPNVIPISGGYVGAVTAWALTMLLGSGKIVGIVVLFLIATILCIDIPIRHLNLRPRRSKLEDLQPKSFQKPKFVDDSDQDYEPDRDGKHAESGEKSLPRQPVKFGKEGASPASLSTEISVPKEGYQLPPLSLLSEPAAKSQRSKQEMQRNIETLEGTLEQFGIDANVVEVANGPTITRYEIQLGPGIRVARITALADNIAMDLAASHVRVEAPIPGKAAIGVEVPNSQPSSVFLRELCESNEFLDHPSRLAIALGKDVSGMNRYADLTKMPHLLIGGATNSGKSIGLCTIITSLLMRNTPKDLRLVMIDPKRVELNLFDQIPHLMCPVIKDVKEAPGVLRAVWREMDHRYDRFSEVGVRNIDGWNAKATFQDRMPYVVVIIDELADLMIQSAAEVETSICRLAQLARATGIHLVIATQRPSVDVITGTIKANVASRIAFTVSSQIDSRTILDTKGAESLIGKGDMLFLPIDASKPLRIQGCYVSEKEIADVCSFWRAQEPPAYSLTPVESEAVGGPRPSNPDEEDVDQLWEESIKWVAERGQASTSMLQRKFSIGFQRASRLLDMMEERGIVGPRDGPRPREVLLSASEASELFAVQVPPEGGWKV